MSDVVLYIILSIFAYGEDTPSVIEVRLAQPDIATCEKQLADLEIIEGPELMIFGTKLDIEAYCFSVNSMIAEILNNDKGDNDESKRPSLNRRL